MWTDIMGPSNFLCFWRKNMLVENHTLSKMGLFFIAAQGLERKAAWLCGFNLEPGTLFMRSMVTLKGRPFTVPLWTIWITFSVHSMYYISLSNDEGNSSPHTAKEPCTMKYKITWVAGICCKTLRLNYYWDRNSFHSDRRDCSKLDEKCLIWM